MKLRFDESVEAFRAELLEWLAANRPPPEEMAANDAELARLLVEGRARPHVGARFPLAEVAGALRLVADGRAVGKVVLDLP